MNNIDCQVNQCSVGCRWSVSVVTLLHIQQRARAITLNSNKCSNCILARGGDGGTGREGGGGVIARTIETSVFHPRTSKTH